MRGDWRTPEGSQREVADAEWGGRGALPDPGLSLRSGPSQMKLKKGRGGTFSGGPVAETPHS